MGMVNRIILVVLFTRRSEGILDSQANIWPLFSLQRRKNKSPMVHQYKDRIKILDDLCVGITLAY